MAAISPAPAQLAGDGSTNAAVAVFLGAYLLIALYQGNLGALATQAKADFLGTGTGNNATGFWRWALALLILIWISGLPSLRPYRTPIVGFVLVAMLIEVASGQQSAFANLTNSIATLFGRGGQSSTTQTTSTGVVAP